MAAEGRWSLRAARWSAEPGDTDRRAALARSLLDRYGVVHGEVVEAETVPGGFSSVYTVLKSMEEAGRVRRGYFIADRGPVQFALPGADDRLRAHRAPPASPRMVVLAATDPANPYGAVIPWPSAIAGAEESRRPQRSSGSLVFLRDGRLVGWLGRKGETLLTWLDTGESARDLARALAELVDRGKRKVLWIRAIDGGEPRRSELYASLLAESFSGGARGLHRRSLFPRQGRSP